MFGCICFSVNILLPTRSRPPKSLGSKEGAGLNCIFQTKRKKKTSKHSLDKPVISSPRSPSHSWKTVRSDNSKNNGLHCPIPRNRLSGSLLFKVQLPKKQRCVQQLVGPQLAVSTAGQMWQSQCTHTCANISEPDACRRVPVGRAGAPWLCCLCLSLHVRGGLVVGVGNESVPKPSAACGWLCGFQSVSKIPALVAT